MKIPQDLSQRIRAGEIGVLPTDTIYGLVASAFNVAAIERVYAARGRDQSKKCIVLIGAVSQLADFGISPDKLRQAEKYWPGPVSLELKVKNFEHLHRGTKSNAFRLPKPEWLQRLLIDCGPIIAPSANPQGQPPAKTIEEAKQYFGSDVDFYVDGGKLENEPSQLISLLGDQPVRLR